jgi:putative endonuclease
MKKDPRKIGVDAESIAADFLTKQGFKILEKNFKTKVGELDIIARDKDTLCFVEVKCRSNLSHGLPEETVNYFKQRKLAKAALFYLKQYNLLDSKARFDVVSVNLGQGKIGLLKDAFELDRRYLY